MVTNDFNLNKIATLQGVDVINLNEMANALKTVALPGEAMVIRIVKPGDQPGQGIGYLDDGTMVVVEQGRPHIGAEVSITVTSVLQTPAGRMIFGRVEAQKPGPVPGTAEVAATGQVTETRAARVSNGGHDRAHSLDHRGSSHRRRRNGRRRARRLLD